MEGQSIEVDSETGNPKIRSLTDNEFVEKIKVPDSSDSEQMYHLKKGRGDANAYSDRYDPDKEFFDELLKMNGCSNGSYLLPDVLSPEDPQFYLSTLIKDSSQNTASSPSMSVIYMKQSDNVEPEEEKANPEILDFIQSIARKHCQDLNDDNFLNSQESSGDLGFLETFAGESDSSVSVYDETFIGRADIFRPTLTPSERTMLGISIVPEELVDQCIEKSEADCSKCSSSQHESETLIKKFERSLVLSKTNPDKLSAKKPVLQRRRFIIPDFKYKSPAAPLQLPIISKEEEATHIHRPELKYLISVSPHPENKSDLKKARQELIQTIKWQSKLDKRAGDDLWKSCKSRIKTVETEYKIVKEEMKETARRESLRKLSMKYRNAEEDLHAKFITSKDILINEFNVKVNKLTGKHSTQAHILGNSFLKTSKKIEKKLLTRKWDKN